MKTLEMICGTVVVILVISAVLVYGRPHMEEGLRLTKQLNSLKSENERIEQRIAELNRMQANFRNDPEYVELTARREGFIRKNEVIYVYE